MSWLIYLGAAITIGAVLNALDGIKHGLNRIEQSIDILRDQQSDQHFQMLSMVDEIRQGVNRISPVPLPVKDWITEEEWARRAKAVVDRR